MTDLTHTTETYVIIGWPRKLISNIFSSTEDLYEWVRSPVMAGGVVAGGEWGVNELSDTIQTLWWIMI